MGSPTLSLPPALSPWLGSYYQWPCCLSQAWLLHSSMVTQVLPGSCRSRDSMLELASLEQLMHRRMEWCSEGRVEATMKGLDSTAMWMTRERLSLSSTALELMDSGSLKETTFPLEVRTLLLP